MRRSLALGPHATIYSGFLLSLELGIHTGGAVRPGFYQPDASPVFLDLFYTMRAPSFGPLSFSHTDSNRSCPYFKKPSLYMARALALNRKRLDDTKTRVHQALTSGNEKRRDAPLSQRVLGTVRGIPSQIIITIPTIETFYYTGTLDPLGFKSRLTKGSGGSRFTN